VEGDVSRETDEPAPEVVQRLFSDRAAAAYAYVSLLTGRGVERGLLGPREGSRIWHRHVLNCAVIAPAFGLGDRVCDIGSGAGLPGAVLAIARPDLQLTLVESLLRRATFLAEVVDELALSNVVVRRARAEELHGREIFDVVTARAVAPLDVLAGWALPLLEPGGELIALKGESAEQELASARTVLRRLGAVDERIERYGSGMVAPPTIVVRLRSSRTLPQQKGSR
jgi:16S rRNA (guanine527-N7)-methyltransferase